MTLLKFSEAREIYQGTDESHMYSYYTIKYKSRFSTRLAQLLIDYSVQVSVVVICIGMENDNDMYVKYLF